MPIVTLPASQYPNTPIADAISKLGTTYLRGVKTPGEIANQEAKDAYFAAQTRQANAKAGVDEGVAAGRAKAAGAVQPGSFDPAATAGVVQGLLGAGDTSNLGNVLLALRSNLDMNASPDALIRGRTGAGEVTELGQGVTAADRDAQGAAVQANVMQKVGAEQAGETQRQQISSSSSLAGTKYSADSSAATARRGQDMTAETTRRGQDLSASSSAYDTATDAETARRDQLLRDRASQREAAAKPDELTTLGRLMDEAGMTPEQKQKALQDKVRMETTRAEGSPPATPRSDPKDLEAITMGALALVPGATFIPEGGKDPILDPDFEKSLDPQKAIQSREEADDYMRQTGDLAGAQRMYLEGLGIKPGSTFQPAVEGGLFSQGQDAALVPPAGAGPAPAMAAPPALADLVAGQIYDTPKGRMLYKGEGRFAPAPAGDDLQGGAGQDRLGGGAPAPQQPAPGPGPMRYENGKWIRAGGAETPAQRGQDANLRYVNGKWVPTGKGRPVGQ